jgi:hypothetical protein
MPISAKHPVHTEAKSMPDIFSSVRVSQSPQFWKRLLGFIGPGFLISVGYMTPETGRRIWLADLVTDTHSCSSSWLPTSWRSCCKAFRSSWVYATQCRRLSAGDLYQRPQQNGPVRQPAMAQSS